MGEADKQAKPSFYKGLKAEFKKITWPDRQSTMKQSVAVVIVTMILGLIISVIDYAVKYGVNFLTSL